MTKRVEITLAVLANLCTVVTAVVAILMGRDSKPRLTYVVHPTRTVIADPTRTSKIEVRVNGEPVKRPIMAAQVLLFNDSERMINENEFTGERVRIESRSRVAFIDAVEKVKRPRVTELTLDRSELTAGIVPLRWKIMQRRHDGVIVTLFYSADHKDIQFDVLGVLLNQSGPVRVIVDPAEKLEVVKRRLWEIIAVVVIGFLLFGGLVYATFGNRRLLAASFIVALFAVTSIAVWRIKEIVITPDLPLPF